MKTTLRKASLLAISLASALTTACSSAPSEGNAHASREALAGDYCDSFTPCGTGFYCAPDPSSPACGSGSCVASPGVCPGYETTGVCGCDGQHYLNATCAAMSGASTQGPWAVAGAQVSDVVGTWSRVMSSDTTTHVEAREVLQLNADSTYTLKQTERCVPTPGYFCWRHIKVTGEASGTVVPADGANGGFLFQGTSCDSGDCSTMATEFRLEHDCADYAGALKIGVIEPPGSSEAKNTFYLQRP